MNVKVLTTKKVYGRLLKNNVIIVMRKCIGRRTSQVLLNGNKYGQ